MKDTGIENELDNLEFLGFVRKHQCQNGPKLSIKCKAIPTEMSHIDIYMRWGVCTNGLDGFCTKLSVDHYDDNSKWLKE
jgi:hypothetical protein